MTIDQTLDDFLSEMECFIKVTVNQAIADSNRDALDTWCPMPPNQSKINSALWGLRKTR